MNWLVSYTGAAFIRLFIPRKTYFSTDVVKQMSGKKGKLFNK